MTASSKRDLSRALSGDRAPAAGTGSWCTDRFGLRARFGRSRPLRKEPSRWSIPWALRLGLGSKASWREDSLPRRQERQEASGGGCSEKALSALVPPVDDRRDLRAALQRASVRRFGGLEREGR